MAAYFNEHDPHAAAWLRELIRRGLIADGEVDERSIADVSPDDLRGFTQCHFFAGIGVWSYALRSAGWPDDRPVWTGSCPCQPFSPAGKGGGFADERHLWPAFFHLISQCRPVVCFGEQVEGKDGLPWLDLVQDDLEGCDYAVGAVVTPAAGYGAPHARHRLYWVADAECLGRERGRASQESGRRAFEPVAGSRDARDMADDGGQRRERGKGVGGSRGQSPERGEAGEDAGDDCQSCKLGHTNGTGSQSGEPATATDGHGCAALADGSAGVAQGDTSSTGLPDSEPKALPRTRGRDKGRAVAEPGGSPVGGFWADAEWIHCRPEPKYPAGRWRAVEPGTFPLAHGATARVVKLRGYGNAIVAPQAKAFIEAYLEVEGGR